MKPRWNIRINWFVDGRSVISGETDFFTDPDSECPEECAMLVANALNSINESALIMLAARVDAWDGRRTEITLARGRKSRSIAINDDGMGMTKDEACLMVERITEWLTADETTELLLA
jgi:hypothetical protein